MSVIMRNDIEVGGTDDGIIAKVGTDTLDTTAQDLSGAVNELNSNLIKVVRLSASTEVTANQNANILFDISSLSDYTIIGHSIERVSASGTINNIVRCLFYSDNGVRVTSTSAQTITVYGLFFYI